MNELERKSMARNFVKRWQNRGYEKGEMQTFWLSFLRDVMDIEKPENYVKFEVPVKLKHTKFIDAFFPDTNVIVEQKSLTENLSQEKSQSDDERLTPYEQAQRYGTGLPYSMRPRWIIVCNFAEFLIYDMETRKEPQKILLEELPKNFHIFDFLIDAEKARLRIELEISLKAGEIVGKIYDALKPQYINPDSDESLQSLNKLCVRLVFCMYSESTGVFGKHKIFRDYLENSRDIRRDLHDLFDVLNTPYEKRDPYLADYLKIFPYVNGGLFADGRIEIPNFTPAIKELLVEEASSNFDWSGISPTIFGAVFESTLNPVTRRAGGMHYTSVENIHKVIDPLFLDDLRAEFDAAKKSARKRKALIALQDKLAALRFFDPACGSGIFLTETYLSLRRLENEILKELLGTQIHIGEFSNPVKISIAQFYGIEINDFAVAVAQTALWISEIQMLLDTQEIINRELDFFPIQSHSNITVGNALQLDWKKIAPPNLINFVIGNPPFVGRRYRNSKQAAEIEMFFDYKDVDYVACWYAKADCFIQNTKIRCAFVSTNSITQGEQVSAIWKVLNSHIDFAYRTFKWKSESFYLAHVHVVIIGFSHAPNEKPKIIFDGDQKIVAENINGYLLNGENIFVESRSKPLCNVPLMCNGNMAADGKNFSLDVEEYEKLIKRYPLAKKFIKRLVGAEEFINSKIRYCLWLVDATPDEIGKMPLVKQRVKKVQEFRLNSLSFKNIVDRPHLFRDLKNPASFIVIPAVSSENRQYVPMGFLNADYIPTTQVQIIPDATLYHFGVLTSNVHMAWTRVVCGRLKSDYRYSKDIVYNNFVWCEPTAAQRKKIEETAQKILDVREKYSTSTLAALYDELLMPKDLRDAHKENDRAVMAAYGFDKNLSEAEIVAALMEMYKNLTKKNLKQNDTA